MENYEKQLIGSTNTLNEANAIRSSIVMNFRNVWVCIFPKKEKFDVLVTDENDCLLGEDKMQPFRAMFSNTQQEQISDDDVEDINELDITYEDDVVVS